MSIASFLPMGASAASQMMSSVLSQLQGTSSVTSGNATGPSYASVAASTPAPAASIAPTGGSQGTLSDQILRLLVMMQNETAPASNTAAQNTASASANPVSQLFSAIDTNGSPAISQGQLETYIEGQGGTQTQADALYSGLTGNGSDSLTESQLEKDLQNAGPAGMAHHHARHHGGSGNTSSSTLLSMLSTLTQAVPGDTSA
jgi:hypothetical protein